jgi:hypothetical protein
MRLTSQEKERLEAIAWRYKPGDNVDIDYLLNRLTDALFAVERLRSLLRRLEWAGTTLGGWPCCPACGAEPPEGHRQVDILPGGPRALCWLATALKENLELT